MTTTSPKKKSSQLAQHSKATPEWGTPSALVELIRQELGGTIELDPATSYHWNKTIQAKRIFTRANAERNPASVDWSFASTILLNPPGGLVSAFWAALMRWRLQRLAIAAVPKAPKAHARFRAVWVGYSLEQLATLQDHELSPLDFPTLILRKRLSFEALPAPPVQPSDEDPQLALPPEKWEVMTPAKNSPTHANYLTLVSGGNWGCDTWQVLPTDEFRGKNMPGNQWPHG